MIPSSGQNGLSRFESRSTRRAAADLGRHADALATTVAGGLVVAQAEVYRRAEPAVARPLGELDLRHEPRLDPADVARRHAREARHLVKRWRPARERVGAARSASSSLSRIPSRRFPRTAGRPPSLHREQQRADVAARRPPRLVHPTTRNSCRRRSLTFCQSGERRPGGTATSALRDQPFEPVLPRGREERVAVVEDGESSTPRSGRRPRRGVRGAPRAADEQRHAVELEEVEGDEHERSVAALQAARSSSDPSSSSAQTSPSSTASGVRPPAATRRRSGNRAVRSFPFAAP